MAKTVKLADIAKEVGVSVVTVSKALSGQKGVSEEMRKRIVELADELGYRQPSVRDEARGKNIGVLLHEKHFSKYNSFYLNMYQLLTTKLSANGNFGLLEIVSYDMEKKLLMPGFLKEGKIDGLILQGEFSREYCEFIKERAGVPVIYLDFPDEEMNSVSIVSDSFYGSYYMTNYLFEHGHRNIAFVGSLLQTTSITDRYLGYVKSLMEHGVEIRPDWQMEDRDKETGIIFTPDRIPLPLEMPTAFVCNCDLTAGVLIKRLEAEGFRVPEDYSVVGFDNFIFPGACDVAITTYEVDANQMVTAAAMAIEKLVAGSDVRLGIQIVTGHLVEKQSVKSI